MLFSTVLGFEHRCAARATKVECPPRNISACESVFRIGTQTADNYPLVSPLGWSVAVN